VHFQLNGFPDDSVHVFGFTWTDETSAYKIQTPGINEKKAFNIPNTAKFLNQE
jgi:hypothetical protein